jgi:hypothetical protein
MLRYSADYRTLLWMLVLMPALIAYQYVHPEMLPYLSWLSFYFAIAAGVIAHNHLHVPTFENKKLSTLFGYWIAIFYGFPTFAWIPTHNLNHLGRCLLLLRFLLLSVGPHQGVPGASQT